MHPVLLKIGWFQLRSYGLFLLLALLAGLAWAHHEFQRRRLPIDFLADCMLVLIPVGAIGARLLYVVLNLNEFVKEPLSAFALWSGGLSLFGALITGIASIAILARRRQLDFWEVGDASAPAYLLAYAIGRIGCFFNGCCIGYPTNLPWAIRFHDPLTLKIGPPSHPVPLYSAIGSFILFAIVLKLRGRVRITGQLMLWTLMLHLSWRFAMEFFRKGATAKELAFGLTEAQVACIIGIIALAWIHQWRLHQAIASAKMQRATKAKSKVRSPRRKQRKGREASKRP
ncbi:MAG TPA: prolipoprotein diacylglyceryl transferase [Armatimonadetes bacterium]|nr:prolipoprotein diacylglyceryl transferase [Armatimonadota bacterium]